MVIKTGVVKRKNKGTQWAQADAWAVKSTFGQLVISQCNCSGKDNPEGRVNRNTAISEREWLSNIASPGVINSHAASAAMKTGGAVIRYPS